MNFNNLLNQVLGAVQQSGNKVMSDNNPLNSFGGGALIGGLAAMLLKKGGTKSLLKAGSAAALGMMAYQAYQNWQGGRQNSTSTLAALPEAAFAAQGQLAEERSRVILRTMIAAASDGLIDETEKQLIAQESGADSELRQWLANEYSRPASINELAEAVGGDQALAAEAYLAARAVCGDLVRGEIAFLSRLSQALGLDDGLVEQLERQLASAQ